MTQVHLPALNFSALSKEEEGGEKKCLPGAIYLPPIIKSHRQGAIRRPTPEWHPKFENLWHLVPYSPPRRSVWTPEGLYGTQGVLYGTFSGEGAMGSYLTTFVGKRKSISWS